MENQSPNTSKSLIIRPASFSPAVRKLIQIATPQEFVKTRPGKGNRNFTYVEGGYVIARLNQMFKNCWDFKIINERVEPNEVIVRGVLIVKDFRTGYKVTKTQYGTRDRNAGVPLGDTMKAAATDCLKKCASLLGVALDVYWQQLDETKLTGKKQEVVVPPPQGAPAQKIMGKNSTVSRDQATKIAIDKVKAETDEAILSRYYQITTTSKLYDANQKKIIVQAIADQRKKLQGKLL